MTLAERLRCNARLLAMMLSREIPISKRDLRALADDLRREADAIERAAMREAEAAYRRQNGKPA